MKQYQENPRKCNLLSVLTRVSLLVLSLSATVGRAVDNDHSVNSEGDPADYVHHYIAKDLPGDDWFHTVGLADLYNDGDKDYIIASGNPEKTIWWYAYHGPDTWVRHTLGAIDQVQQAADTADIDDDGDNDIVHSDRWLENNGRGGGWVAHPIPFGRMEPAPWDAAWKIMATRSVVIDMDRDGDSDIVIGDCDLLDSTITVLYNQNGLGTHWHKVILPQNSSYRRGSLHSLRVADFDLDGTWDIFSADQEDLYDPIYTATGRTPKLYLWENRHGTWSEQVIFDGALGIHEAHAEDVDGDGDIDIVGKTWRNGGAWNGNQGQAHADYFENRYDTAPPSAGIPRN